jgi:hypothetical protein
MAKAKRKQAIAKVKVTLEIVVDSVWGEDCTIGQVHKQATDQATLLIRQSFDLYSGRISIYGKPLVEAIVLPEK